VVAWGFTAGGPAAQLEATLTRPTITVLQHKGVGAPQGRRAPRATAVRMAAVAVVVTCRGPLALADKALCGLFGVWESLSRAPQAEKQFWTHSPISVKKAIPGKRKKKRSSFEGTPSRESKNQLLPIERLQTGSAKTLGMFSRAATRATCSSEYVSPSLTRASKVAESSAPIVSVEHMMS
jgi:hypothetical protein